MAEITEQQATDLARYFLGPGWEANSCGGACTLMRGRLHHNAISWRKAFRLAGVALPVRRHFANVGRTVKFGSESVAECYSNSMAERIANALNTYRTDRRGT